MSGRTTPNLRDTSSTLAASSTVTIDLENGGLSSLSLPSTAYFSTRTSTARSSTAYHHEEEKDVGLVDWDGPEDPQNPRNWVRSKRWIVTLVVSLFTFISPVASSMIAPSLSAVSNELGMQPGGTASNMSLSIFVLAYALGPLFWGPASEILGRLPILQISNCLFLIFNLACGFAQTPTQLLAFRFLAGLGGAAPQSVGGGVVGDLWRPEERGTAMSIYSLAPLIGPATGPLVGGWIAQKATTWRWVFWSSSIADAILQVAGFLLLRETYAPVLLRRKAARLNASQVKDVSCDELTIKKPRTIRYYTQSEKDDPVGWKTRIARGMLRPIVFLATEPIVQVFALYMAVLYGVLYLFLTTFVGVWTGSYHEESGIAGMHYLSIALGSTVGGQVGARVLDRVYLKLRARNGGIATPEMRLPLLMATAATLPIGLVMYGWTAQAKAYWLLPDIGVFIFSVGIGGNWTCIQTYLVDSYSLLAASAIASCTSFRALAGFGFPLFANEMYGKLGDGWGNTVLALVCLVIGCPSPFIFYKYGPWLRQRSRAAEVEQ